MNKPLVLIEIEPGRDILELEPGMYAADCGGRLSTVNVDHYLNCTITPEILAGCFSGAMLPYFLHNINNLMVGVMGNLDLAGMFMPDLEKVGPKITAARNATGVVVDFIRDISETYSPSSASEISGKDIDKIFTSIKAACGRSVSTDGLDKLKLESVIICTDPAAFISSVFGMGVWCVLCMGGNGSLNGMIGENTVSLTWSRPPEAGNTHMPGSESAVPVIAMTGGQAVCAGYRILVENWTDSSGTVTLAFK